MLLAGFLVMTYLAVPAFPWLPVPPNNEGNYYYVNKNMIELLALLALAPRRQRPLVRPGRIDSTLVADSNKASGRPDTPTPARRPTNQVSACCRRTADPRGRPSHGYRSDARPERNRQGKLYTTPHLDQKAAEEGITRARSS